jgi:hypothetical protein
LAALSLEILPPRAYVERTALGQVLNFDLRFTNGDGDGARLSSIVVEVFDRHGERLLRRVVDEHGLRPAIETVGERDVPGGGSLLVFNPVHTFPAQIDLATVRCTCCVGEAVLVAEIAPRGYEQTTTLFLPLTGRVLVASGHDFLSPHRRIDPGHPFAAELGVRTNSGRFADDYTLEADPLGAVVHAPGAGAVVAARGDVPDNSLGCDGVEFAPLPADPAGAIFGNHVVLDHGNREFSVVGHLQFGSVEVEAGHPVEAMQPIGRLGLSGNTDFPHIHYQLQDGPDARTAEGLPFRLEGLGPLEAGTTVDVA